MSILIRGILLIIGLLFLWQAVVIIFQLPSYILPTPLEVFKVAYASRKLIASEAIPTILETLLGLTLGVLLGYLVALMMVFFSSLTLWLLPILLISQAMPTFAIAPLLVIWLGYGLWSKVVTTIIMLFFPVTSAFYDGLKRTDSGWLDLAKTMNAKKWRVFWHIRIPAALPALASGIRVATAIAPIGAVVGEWVGASRGLGFLMLNANARMQIDLMFAALFTIVLFSLLLYFCINKLLCMMISWQLES
jgi:putative hydroxymethylpyrimidine transport system permease protein